MLKQGSYSSTTIRLTKARLIIEDNLLKIMKLFSVLRFKLLQVKLIVSPWIAATGFPDFFNDDRVLKVQFLQFLPKFLLLAPPDVLFAVLCGFHFEVQRHGSIISGDIVGTLS